MQNKSALIMLVGLPACGKSTWAETYIRDKPNTVIHSSDAIREELLNDETNQSNNQLVFETMRKRTVADLKRGKTVIYDATNLSKKRRIAFLRDIKSIDVKKMVVLFLTPYAECLARNNARSRVVPEEAMKKMYYSFEPPHISEGWDEIEMIKSISEEYDTLFDLKTMLNELDSFDQKNKHHSATLGGHLRLAQKYVKKNKPNDDGLAMAALLHDIGKVQTQTRLNMKGEFDGDYHYYQHHCVSAYECLFYLAELYYDLDDMLRISNLIYYHMHPYLAWKQSEKAKTRDIRIIGEEMFNDIMILHKADLSAH